MIRVESGDAGGGSEEMLWAGCRMTLEAGAALTQSLGVTEYVASPLCVCDGGSKQGGRGRLRRGRHKEGKPMTEWPWKKAG